MKKWGGSGGANPIPGTTQHPVAYLSKTLDMTSQGWPPCLRVLAVTAVLTREASKLTIGNHLQTHNSLHSSPGLRCPQLQGIHWISDSRIQKYQALFLEGSEISIKPCTILDPATLLPKPNPNTFLLHFCLR